MNKHQTQLALSTCILILLGLARPTFPCQIPTLGIGGPVLGADGLVHWTAPAWHDGVSPSGRGWQESPYWLTRTGVETGPEAIRMTAPLLTEAEASMVGVLPDGSAWWNGLCPDWDPPETIACGSLLLVGPAGEPMGRVSSERGQLFLEGDGTLLSLEVVGSNRNTSGQQRSGGSSGQRLQFWRGSAIPLQSFEGPAVGDHWDEDYSKLEANRPRDGWGLVWEGAVPFSPRTDTDRLVWALSGDRELLAAVSTTREEIKVGVYEMPAPGSSAPLVVRYERSFPHARGGLSEDREGNAALAEPWAVALSSRGELAMGRWQTNPDCSTDRPGGFVVLGETGELIADVRRGPDRGRTEGLTFDADDHLVVAQGGLTTYTSDGKVLGVSGRTPQAWLDAAKERGRRADELTEASPLEDWVELQPWFDVMSGEAGHRSRVAMARRIIVGGWPAVDSMLSDHQWLELAQQLCAAHPDAAQSALMRFESARGQRKGAWLGVLPECFEAPPDSALATAKAYLKLRNPAKQEVAEEVLARWQGVAEISGAMWERAAAGYLSTDYRQRTEARKLLVLLLASIGEQKETFEEKLRGNAEDRELATAVLFSSFSAWSSDYVPDDMRPVRASLVGAARDWVATGEPELAQIGGLLLLGHGAWPGVGWPATDAEEGNVGRLKSLLREASTGAGDVPIWAGVAVQRVLLAAASRPANADTLRVPSPETVGLPRAQVLAVFEQTAGLQEEVATDRMRSREFPATSIEETRHVLARSLGVDGRVALMRSLDGEAPAIGVQTHSSTLWEVVTWMNEDLNPWTESQVSQVLDRLQADPNSGWQSGPLLDAVVRKYAKTHALNHRARTMFRDHIAQAVALAAPVAAPASAQRGRPSQMLQQMIGHLSDTGPRGGEPSPILTELERTDVAALASSASTNFEQWLGLMGIVGPWPSAVPELERMLAGNSSTQAAIVLSHIRAPGALDVLLNAPGHYYEVSTVANAIGRFGADGVQGLVGLVGQALAAGESPQSFRLLVEVLRVDSSLLAHAKDAVGFSEMQVNLQEAVNGAIAVGRWPSLSQVLLLDVFGAKAFDQMLGALAELPSDANSVRSFFYQSGTWASAVAFERFGEVAAAANHPHRSNVVRVASELAAEGGEQARWLVQLATAKAP